MSNIILMDMIKKERTRRAAEGSLYEFMKQSWPIIEPGVEFVPSWHLEVIAEHLEAVAAGEIKDLVICMPPRAGKSISIAVMWPVWTWIERPEHKWLFASYANSLSVRDSLKCRRLIQSDWFQEKWGHRFELVGDQNAKTLFENDRTGYRFATSVGGSTTGHGGDTIVVDDPLNSVEAQSEAMRESALEWWDQAMSTRLNNPKKGTRVVVMQRLHEKDLAGHLLAQGGWDHLCLPMEYDGRRIISTATKQEDPRTEHGQLLCPDRFGYEELERLKRALGEYGAAGQLQQRPSPAGGGIIKVKHFQLWPHDRRIPALDYLLQSYDTAYSEKTTGDPSACTVWGIFTHNDGRRGAILMDAWAENLGYPDLRARVIDDWSAKYGADKNDARNKGRRPDNILVEEKSSGISLVQDLRKAGIPVVTYNPGRADKVAKAHQATPLLETDCFYVIESTQRPGAPVSWAQTFLDQCERFPKVDHDDLVDTWTQAAIWLRDNNWLDLQYHEEIDDDYDDVVRKRVNPYGA